MIRCGYSFWGYLGDIKYTRDGEEASTPDGNAFYSWCIIRELQKRGYEVTQIMPDRDEKGFRLYGDNLFGSWIESERLQAYIGTKKVDYNIIYDYLKMFIDTALTDGEKKQTIDIIKNTIYGIIEENCEELDFILHEYRMLIPGRNDYYNVFDADWQPDYLIQECLFDYCCKTGKRLILFDLDYKLNYIVYKQLQLRGCPVIVFELGKKWEMMARYVNVVRGIKGRLEARQVYIPFDFDCIDYFDVKHVKKNNLIYVGNRYERDWCIDKYIPYTLTDCKIYGNWLEGNRDSQERWSHLQFGKRLQVRDMRDVYASSVATILLAKKEYCEYGFMTARIIEAIFYGTVPLFIEEYGEDVIKEYAGDYAKFLTVRNKYDVHVKVDILKNKSCGQWQEDIIKCMRDRLKFMDVKHFVDVIEEVK